MYSLVYLHLSVHGLPLVMAGCGEAGGRHFKNWNSVVGDGQSNTYLSECGESTLKQMFSI